LSGYRPPRFTGLGAHVSGVSAWVLVSILERAKALDSIQKMPAEAREEVLQTYDALRAAGIYWDEQRRENAATKPVPHQGAADPVADAEPPSNSERWTAEQVASALGVVPRRVGQLVAAGRLDGVKVGNMWMITTDSVEDYQAAETLRRRAA
jgi:hypothetical protein